MKISKERKESVLIFLLLIGTYLLSGLIAKVFFLFKDGGTYWFILWGFTILCNIIFCIHQKIPVRHFIGLTLFMPVVGGILYPFVILYYRKKEKG
jgi:hypothetical protein